MDEFDLRWINGRATELLLYEMLRCKLMDATV